MFSYHNRNETEREEYLARELERERDERREQEEREYQKRETQRKERGEESHQRHEDWMRSASDWPEALAKQARLCRREVTNEIAMDKKFGLEAEPDEYFQQSANANEKALEIWQEVTAEKQSQIEELERHIEAVWDSVRGEVADKLRAVSSHTAWVGVAEAIRNDSLDGYLDW